MTFHERGLAYRIPLDLGQKTGFYFDQRALRARVEALAHVPGGVVKKNEVFVEWDAYNVPIISEKTGQVKFVDIIEGVTMKFEFDETTGQEAVVIIDHKEDLHPQIIIADDRDEPLLDPAIFREERWDIFGTDRPMWFFELEGDTVWGATAAMLRQLLGFVTGTVSRGDLGHI